MSNRKSNTPARILAILAIVWLVLHLFSLLFDVIKHSKTDKEKPKAAWESTPKG